MQGSDIVSVCNVYCRAQPALGHWANETAPAAGLRGDGGKGGGGATTKSGLVFFPPLTRANTHKTLKKEKEGKEGKIQKDRQKNGPQ